MAAQTVTIETVQIKRSSGPGVVPDSLLRGEEFVNFADGIRLIGDGRPVAQLERYPLVKAADLQAKLSAADLIGRDAIGSLYRATDYNVKADGVTNCAPALQSLIDRLGALDQISTIYLPPGIYVMNAATITIPRNVYVFGAGPGDCPLECFKGRPKDMRGTILLFKGAGPRVLTQIGVTADGPGGGVFTNPSARNANDASYSLTNFYNADASRVTGAAATPKPFSACVRVDGGGREGAHVAGLRIMLSFDGSATPFGYVNKYAYVGGYSELPPENLGQADYDIGLYTDNTVNANFEDIVCLGYFRMAGVYHSMYKHQLIQTDPLSAITDNDNGAERTRFIRCKTMGQVGYLSRAGDTWPVIGRTTNTLDIPWADYHPFDPVLLGQRLRVVSNGGTGTINFTGTQFVPAAAGLPDRVRLTGVTPDPTAGSFATQLDPTNYAAVSPAGTTFATSGTLWRDSDIFDMNHASVKRATDLSGATLRPSACVEISGATLRDEVFDHCHFRGPDDVLMHLHNCFNIHVCGNSSVEAFFTNNGVPAGKRLIASPAPKNSTRVPYPAGATTTVEWYGTQNWSFVDTGPLYPTIVGSSRPTKFGLDTGFFDPASCYFPAAVLSGLSYGCTMRRVGAASIGLADISNTLLLGIQNDDQTLFYRTNAGDGLGYVNRGEYRPNGGNDYWRFSATQFVVAPRAVGSGSADPGPVTILSTFGRTQLKGALGKTLIDVQDNNLRIFNSDADVLAQFTHDAFLLGKALAPFSTAGTGTLDVGASGNGFRNFYGNEYRFNSGPRDLTGSGAPEGVVTAPVGSTYRRLDGGVGSSFYVKESGAGSAGWKARIDPTTPPSLAGWPAGTLVWNANISGTASAALGTAGNMVFVPIVIPVGATATQIGLSLVTGQSGAECRLAIYADNGSTPTGGALLVDAGVVDLSGAAGYKSATISTALPAGLVWVCIQIKAVAVQASVYRVSAANGLYILGSSTYLATGSPPRYYVATGYTYGTMPTTGPSVLASAGGDAVLIGVKN